MTGKKKEKENRKLNKILPVEISQREAGDSSSGRAQLVQSVGAHEDLGALHVVHVRLEELCVALMKFGILLLEFISLVLHAVC